MGTLLNLLQAAVLVQATKHDVSQPLRTIRPHPPLDAELHERFEAESSRALASTPDFVDPMAQILAPAMGGIHIEQSFEGLGVGFVGPAGEYGGPNYTPPDTNGDVGPNHFVQTVNVSFVVLDKRGTPVYGPASLNTLFDGFGGDCEQTNQGDPAIKYDALADRWVISYFAVSGPPDWECVAVSTTGDPTGAWRRYAFRFGAFNDYPKLAVWPDAYYLTFNMFFDDGELGWACAIDRAAMLAGGNASMQCFSTPGYDGLLPADPAGRSRPPDGAPSYVMALDNDALALWRLHVDWQVPDRSQLEGPISVPVAPFAGGRLVPQPGTSNLLSVLSDRLMYRLSYRRFADHESLVVNHTVSTAGRNGVRWYEIRDPGGMPIVAQQGTFAPDGDWRWMGSASLDAAGNIAMGYSIANDSTRSPSIAVAGRLAADPPGMMGQGETMLIEGTGVQTGSDRWGDYSSMSIDPTDDCTFWYTTEYLAHTGSQARWNTRIGSFRFAACDAAPPRVAILSPADGARVPKSFGVDVDASDDTGMVAKVQLTADGAPLAMASAPPWHFDVQLAVGAHVLSARATDGAGNVATSLPVHVTVMQGDGGSGGAGGGATGGAGGGAVMDGGCSCSAARDTPVAGTVLLLLLALFSSRAARRRLPRRRG